MPPLALHQTIYLPDLPHSTAEDQYHCSSCRTPDIHHFPTSLPSGARSLPLSTYFLHGIVRSPAHKSQQAHTLALKDHRGLRGTRIKRHLYSVTRDDIKARDLQHLTVYTSTHLPSGPPAPTTETLTNTKVYT
ncbi:hypothetical protein MN608_05644 [Microdochium nivale]|nr:hypothetical protein MN608_05644 [Microdochium nivale]